MRESIFDSFGWQREQAIWAASVISNKSRVDRVIKSLDIEAKLDNKKSVESNVPASFQWQQLIDVAETNLV